MTEMPMTEMPMTGTRATETRTDWLADDRAQIAATRILDTAAELFAARGVGEVTMRDIADAAGCSRATLYRHFPGKQELMAAYVERAARTVARDVDSAIPDGAAPDEQLLTATQAAIAGVRANPALSQWFTADMAATSGHLAQLSPAIDAVAAGFLRRIVPDTTNADLAVRAAWLVRVIVSLLSTPEVDAAAERELLRRFVAPTLVTRAN